MLTWNLSSLFLNLKVSNFTKQKLGLHLNEIDLFGDNIQDKSSNCIININYHIAKNYFSKYQHSFFYTDEKITEQSFYASSDFPGMIIGTNYGRIFIMQLFQDIEGRAYPVIVVDCHNGSPIT